MSKWLALASGEEKNSENLADTQHKPSKSTEKGADVPFVLVYDGCRRENSDKNTAPPASTVAGTDPVAATEFKHGFGVGGRPKTWTGKIVSLEVWRQLSEWEKHGPDSRRWNGKTREWE